MRQLKRSLNLKECPFKPKISDLPHSLKEKLEKESFEERTQKFIERRKQRLLSRSTNTRVNRNRSLSSSSVLRPRSKRNKKSSRSSKRYGEQGVHSYLFGLSNKPGGSRGSPRGSPSHQTGQPHSSVRAFKVGEQSEYLLQNSLNQMFDLLFELFDSNSLDG